MKNLSDKPKIERKKLPKKSCDNCRHSGCALCMNKFSKHFGDVMINVKVCSDHEFKISIY